MKTTHCFYPLFKKIGPHEDSKIVSVALKKIRNIGKATSNPVFYEVIGIIPRKAKNVLIQNFDRVRKGQLIAEDKNYEQIAKHDFTAILVNEKAYKNVLCLACKIIS